MEKTRMCAVCKNDMIHRDVECAYWHDNSLVALVKDVPSWVCQLCGHRIYEPGVEQTLRNLVQDYIKMGRTFPVPATSYRMA